MIKDEQHRNQAVTVCHWYYEEGLGQSAIARRLNVSRPTVSRLLAFAKQEGLVRVLIADPQTDLESLARRLKVAFGLREVRLTYDSTGDEDVIRGKLGAVTADYLAEIVGDHDRLGISWGRTLKAVADHLRPNEHKDVSVVQLKGSVSASDFNNYAADIALKFGMAFGTITTVLPLPVIFDNALTRDIVLKDRFINAIVRQGDRTDIAVFTCGTVRDDAMLFKLGYLSRKEITMLQHKAVGDVLSRFIAADGSIADDNIDARTVGIRLHRLRKKPCSILVAGGPSKIASMRAALQGGYANVLITDSQAAMRLLEE